MRLEVSAVQLDFVQIAFKADRGLVFCGSGSFVGESMHDDSTMVFAYYKEGATDPTFLYFACGLKELKC